MTGTSLFTEDFKLEPYWWALATQPKLPKVELPAKVDVVVVGSGYTGLHAALVTARAGRSTLVFDAEAAGFGCSSRNGGQISTSIKPGLAELSRKHGQAAAIGILKEGHRALEWIGEFIAHEQIECDFKVPGRFHAAHNSAQFAKLVHNVRNQPAGLEVPARVVSRTEQHRELGTDVYHGGVVFDKHASLNPARYHLGLLQCARRAGVKIAANCSVTALTPVNGGFKVSTAHGTLWARDVVIASNGYTGHLTPWNQRRVIPIGSYMIATEALPAKLMNRLMPTDRIISDSRKVVFYYRPSPDRSRIIFGGRVSSGETNPRNSAVLLHHELTKLFPELQQVRMSHSWMGFVAYTFDHLAHLGQHNGLYYAMGYCGSGVSMASYFGMRIGQQLLGMPEGRTSFDNIKFPTRAFYRGKPWFLAATVRYYQLLDRCNI